MELNPERASLVREASEYRWSSAAAHFLGKDDVLAKVSPLLGLVPDWGMFLQSGMEDRELKTLRRHERTGRPLGDESYIGKLENRLGT